MKNRITLIEERHTSTTEVDSMKDFEAVLEIYTAKSNGWNRWFDGRITVNFFLLTACIVGLLLIRGPKGSGQLDSAGDLCPDALVGPTELILDYPVFDSPIVIESVKETAQTEKLPISISNTRVHANDELYEGAENPADNSPHLQEARPLNGYENLYTYFQSNLNYPEENRKDSIEGFVKVSFFISKDSSIHSVKVVQSLGERFDEEALRLVTNMPPWIPATRNGVPYATKFIMPIGFKIEGQ